MFRRWHLAGLLGLSLLVLGSCQPEEKAPPVHAGEPDPGPGPGAGPGKLPPGLPPAPPAPLEEKEPHLAGKKVFNDHGCFRCHAMRGGAKGGPPGAPPMPDKGPDLAKVAGKPERNVEWFIAFVSNPSKNNPESMMPAFKQKIEKKDMRSLAEFLASLK